jgi:hypothetical protein
MYLYETADDPNNDGTTKPILSVRNRPTRPDPKTFRRRWTEMYLFIVRNKIIKCNSYRLCYILTQNKSHIEHNLIKSRTHIKLNGMYEYKCMTVILK